jgi:hypothetical protein
MKNIIKVAVNPKFLGSVLDGNGHELNDFRGLSSGDYNAVLTEVYQRSFLSSFLGSYCSWERKRPAKGESNNSGKGSKKSVAIDGVNIDNEVLGNVVCLATKKKYEVTRSETVTVNRLVVIDGKQQTLPFTEKKEKKEKVPVAQAKVLFNFNQSDNVLEIKVLEMSGKDKATEIRCRKELENELEDAHIMMECYYDMSQFVKALFDTLHVHKMCHITGSEAQNMRRIYKHAVVAYPLFAKLDHRKQIDILDKGFRGARTVTAGSRDIHAFAKATFEAMCREGGIIDVVYKHDFITNQMMTYTKIGEHRRDRVNPDNHRQVWEKNCLVFADYVYGKSNIRTSFHAFDLWDLLARGARNSERNTSNTATVW